MGAVVCGVRGSTWAPGAEFVRDGGHTSGVALAHGDEPPTLVLDAGPARGSSPGNLDGQPFRGTILLGLHWGHTHGIPFLAAGNEPGREVTVVMPAQGDPEQALAGSCPRPLASPASPVRTRAETRGRRLKRKTSHWRGAAGAVAVLALLATGCGDGDDTKTVTATDYAFQDLPDSVDAGTTLTLKNASDKEIHELVAFWLPDDEKRSVQQLVNLPAAEQSAVFGRAQPAMVLIAPPGGDDPIKALGDGRLTERGRYAIVCMIPTGANPAAYLAAAQAAQGGPPQVAGGPPHVSQGMYGEISVK